jgi:hypothetical protein
MLHDISSNTLSDQTAIFARLQSLTGAQPVGVTTDMAKPVGVTTDMAKPVGVTADMAKPREHVEHHTRGLGDGKDRILYTQAKQGTSDHNRQIIHDQPRSE